MAIRIILNPSEAKMIINFCFAGCCVLVVRKAVTQLVGDESLQIATEGNRRCLTLANMLLQLLLSNHSSERNKLLSDFSCGLVAAMAKIVENASVNTLNREKMWTNFHCFRSLREFCDSWERFLQSLRVPSCPIFYQHVTAKVMEHVIKLKLPVPNAISTRSQSTSLTYEEENAIRYVGGYVIKSVRAMLKSPQDDELTLGLDEMCITDDDLEPAESEEWLCSIDRGGLIRITDDAYLFFVSIETSVRRHFHIGNTQMMNERFRDAVTQDTIKDDDVLFYWCISSASMSQDCANTLLEKIVNKWITIRGFSFAKTMLEIYKKETKRGTQKSKALRRKLAENNQ